MTRIARQTRNTIAAIAAITIDPRAGLPRIEMGDGIHLDYINANGHRVNRSGIIRSMRPTKTGNWSVTTDTGLRFILSADRTHAVKKDATVKRVATADEIAANAAKRAPRRAVSCGHGDYDNNGICYTCGSYFAAEDASRYM